MFWGNELTGPIYNVLTAYHSVDKLVMHLVFLRVLSQVGSALSSVTKGEINEHDLVRRRPKNDVA